MFNYYKFIKIRKKLKIEHWFVQYYFVSSESDGWCSLEVFRTDNLHNE